MGWWNQTATGESLIPEDTGLVWGDGPADEVDACIDRIRAVFRETWERDPSLAELRAGIEFSLRGYAAGDDAGAVAPEQVPGLLNIVPPGDA